MYNPVSEQIVERLREIVGDSYVLMAQDSLEPYSHDETAGLSAWPEVVVRANSAQEVSQILKLANAERVPVTPRGGGQGLSGGAVPVQGGIVLSLERMNRILEIDHRNLMAIIEPGVITGELHRAVEAEGLFYPPDPASLDSCLMGGNIAEDAGGPRALKYGTTQDYVQGLEVVLPDGEILQLGGKLIKNVSGYDLIHLIVGSEGTLAVVTKIIVKLLPFPKEQIDLLVPFDDIDTAADTVSAMIAQNVIPTTIEFMEREAVKASERMLDKEVPFSDAAAHLLIQLTGKRLDEVEAEMDVVGELCLDQGALDVLVASDRPTRDRLWEARRMIIEAIAHESPMNHTEDISVPRSEIPAVLRGVREISERIGIRTICFGHAGDGNVHVNFLNPDLEEDLWEQRLEEAQQALYDLTLSLGGAITGEHGIGAIRQKYLVQALGETAVDIMRRIKASFDPNGILNPGKIF
jgi:glycolate oxidase